MDWVSYLEVLRRRWLVVAVVLLLDVLASGYLFARSYRHAGYQACLTLYVSDASAPSLILAPSTTLQTAGQLLEGETAANFFADDILDVAQSQHVAAYVSRLLQQRHLPSTATGDINGAVSGSRRDRTVNLCASNPNQASALAVAGGLARAMTAHRARFVGTGMARRTFVTVISDPSSAPVSSRRELLNLALRIILGALVALGLAFLWDAADPTIRNRRELARELGVPVVETEI